MSVRVWLGMSCNVSYMGDRRKRGYRGCSCIAKSEEGVYLKR
jgi:hypothetical protein